MLWSILSYYSNVYTDRLRTTTKEVLQDSLFRIQYLNKEHPEYEMEMLTTAPQILWPIIYQGLILEAF